ncbi:uncharacterized protein LOC114265096 isoform X2 [Camellia sinensis]|uniref:uncharacterized protein LOC114265096 isoform X2 n=1 Tax=Camellia sinensis TaxID=4442 RepID=UPI0010359D75|nr:uncharacterized protein LOC114265096 isoform X2 [Camellia sinensis]
MASLQIPKSSLSPPLSVSHSNSRSKSYWFCSEFNSHSIRSIRKVNLNLNFQSHRSSPISRVSCNLQQYDNQSNGEEPTESLFMKELKKRGMNPTSLLEESNRSIYGDEGIKFMEEEGGSSKRNAVSTDYEKSLSNQRERSMALNSEGFEYFGQTFVHDASIRLPITPPQYIDPYTLLEDERISQTAPHKN